MTLITDLNEPPERRRVDRRTNARIGEMSVPELRRIVLTSLLFAIVLALFLWMVRTVLVGSVLAVVMAVYLRPMYLWLARRLGSPAGAAILALLAFIVPVIAALVYSYAELVDVLRYVDENREEVARRIQAALSRLPFAGGPNTASTVGGLVAGLSEIGEEIPRILRETIGTLSVSSAVFVFTAFYVFTEADSIVNYIRGKIPPRFSELQTALGRNVSGVLYGAVYATLVTQTVKSVVIFLMNVAFGVPLAGVLAILSFVIGFFPIVGSWSVYVPVALWLYVFRDNLFGALAMVAVGFLLNTLFISMYLRPKLAAERSRVLNFYWMFVGLVTGVYTFGLPGILLGPILIGVLKAVVDTITANTNWLLLADEDPLAEERP